MKHNKKIPILAMLFIGLISSCNSDMESLEIEEVNLMSIQSKSLTLPVNLGVAGNFVILSKSGITNVSPSVITGNVGTSPITGAALLLTCPQVSGEIYTVNAAGPIDCRITDAPGLTIAVLNMQAAYTDAAGRSNPDVLNLGAGVIGGQTLTPGLYKWTSTLLIPRDIELNGGEDDVWIFQVAGTLKLSSGVRINLSGGAQAKNIFWQVSDAVTLGTTCHFEGNLLGATSIAVQTGATVKGRLLAQTAVTLQMNTVEIPSASASTPPPVIGDEASASTPTPAIGDEASASTPPPAIGDEAFGGIIAYILQDGDTGYIEGETHGLIAALNDAETRLTWQAAKDYCLALEVGTYNDWILPSKDQLDLLWDNLADSDSNDGPNDSGNIGGFEGEYYWSSTEDDSLARGTRISPIVRTATISVTTANVRAVRAF
jgi:hypothetical protein